MGINEQYTNLFEAILNDDTGYFTSLLECITWPRTTDYLDFELLITALEFGRKSIANHLLDQKCRVSQPNSENHAIHVALSNNTDFTDIVKRLLALGARVSAKNSSGDNAIHVAFNNGVEGRTIDMLLLRYLEETKDNAKNADGLSVFHVVCTRPNLFVMKKFVENRRKEELNCQVDLQCDSSFAGYTPLHFAVLNGHKEIMQHLVMDLNVDAFIQDANKSTPLHLALERHDVHAIDLILAYNFPKIAYMDVVNNSGLSHFMAACAASIQDFAIKFMQVASEHSPKTLNTLINSKVNIPDDNYEEPYAGYSPIHFAAEFGRANTVQQLIHYGASFFDKTAKNYSPLVLAVKHSFNDIAKLIFWCYKQYRASICTDDDTDSNKGYSYCVSEKTEPSEHWYPCKTHFSSLNV